MEKFYKLSLLLIIFGVVFSAPAQTVFQNENLDALSNGNYIAEELTTYWDTYTPGGAGGSEDGTVSNTYSSSPNNSMKILDANDVALYFKSDKSAFTSGYHWYSHKMYVPSGKSGYFNLQAEYDSIWAFEVTIFDPEENGNSWIEYADGNWMYIDSDVAYETWMQFDVIIDLDVDEANLWIDGNHILTWNWSDAGANTLQLANYYGYDSNYEAYYDDIVFGVYAGANDTICASETSYTLSDANADGYDAVTWTTADGDGSFTNEHVVNAVYNPSAQDKTDGFVTLTLSANKTGSATPTTDEMVLSFQAEPTANAGTNVTICQDDTYQLQGQVTNEDSFSWFVYAGSGDLSSEIILDPVFTPPTTGWPDGGQTWLELTAEPISPCQTAAKHIVIVTFEPVPTADAGTYDPICIDDLFTTSDASADNYTAVTWTTTGDGSLSGEHTLTTCNYLPGQNDIDAGEFSLTLEAGNDYCGSVTSTVTVTISKPETECPGDMDVCIDDDPVTLTGATPTGGEYSGTGVNASGEFDPATAGEGTWVITYEYTDTYSCVTSCTFNITVHELPPATCPDDFEVCCSDEPVLLEAPQGKASFTKEFTGTHVSEDNGDYYFTPDCGDIDTFEITYTVTDTVYGCVSSCTFDITVNALPEVTCENDTVCCDNGPVILGPEDVKGLTLVTAYSGDDVTISGGNYVFTPDCNNIDDFTINKVVINHETGCKDSCEFTITVKELPTVTCPADDEVCIDDDPFTLTGGTPAGGTYSGTGVTDNEFDPADAGLGAWEITYEYEDTYGCVSSCTFEITVEPAPSVDAGTDASICESGYQLDGSVENGGNTLWTTFGDGTLSNPNVLNPFYTPGASDKNAGFVKLSLVSESISPCTGLYEDFIWLYITRDLPTVFAGADATSCETDPYVISDAQAGDYSSLLWIRLDADGTFDDSTAMKPEYTFGEGDLLQGYAILKLVASPVSPCALLVEDQITITVQDAPIAGAGLDATICEDDSYQLTGASASNHNGLGWYTEFGSGSFDDDSKLYAEYTPGSTDIIEGSVELCLVASPISPCETADEDCMTLYIQLKPTANAGTDADICEGSTHTLSDASADNYSSVTWLGGDGTFSNRNIEKPTYTPAASEYGTTVTLTLRAYPESPCSDYVEDMVDIYIQKQPTADAGADGEVCEDDSYTVSGASASDNESLHWYTTVCGAKAGPGDGTFTPGSDTTLTPTYTPGPNDISGGEVCLKLVAQPIDPCSAPIESTMKLTIKYLPVVNAGTNATLCENITKVDLDAGITVGDYDEVLWTHDGQGTIDDDAAASTFYTPSDGDADNTVRFTITVTPSSPCETEVEDFFDVYFQPLPEADAGDDDDACEGDSYTLDDANAYNYSAVTWMTTLGDGDFDFSASAVNPTYTPGNGDYTAGSVILQMLVSPINPCTTGANDKMTLSFQKPPVAEAGADDEVCLNEEFTVSDASADYESGVSWEVTTGSGSLTNETTLTPTYTPADGETGEVVLTLTAEPVSPCDVDATDDMTLTIHALPELTSVSLQYGVDPNWDDMAVAGDLDEGYQICLDGLEATHYLLDVDELDALIDYSLIPLEIDYLNPFYHTDSVPDDFFDFWADRDVIAGATGWQGIMWDIINGDAPIFYLVANEVVKGPESVDYKLIDGLQYQLASLEVPLTIPGNYPQGDYTFKGTVKDLYGCTSEEMTMDMEFVHAAIANAGSDATIADNQPYTVGDASAENYQSVSWSHNGNGSLDEGEDDFSPIYTPGIGDAGNDVILTLYADPKAPCAQQATSTMTLTIKHAPVVVITDPVDESILYVEDYQIAGTASDGDGTVTKVEVKINDGLWVDATEINNWTYDASFNHGMNTVKARATDDDNYVSDIDSIRVYVHLHTIALSSGWQMISTYLDPVNKNIENIMNPIVGSLTVMNNLSGIYAPAPYNVNTLVNWNVLSAYQLRMTQAGEITIAGDPLKDNSLEITAGFHYVPVLSDQISPVSTIFNDPGTDVLYMIGDGPFDVYWPAGGLLNLTDLVPGKGYYGAFNNALTITYPDYLGYKPVDALPTTIQSESPWLIVKTGNAHLISIDRNALAQLSETDYIGAFDAQGNCIGYTDLQISEGNLPLVVYGDDIYTAAKDGANEGELISLVALDAISGEETTLLAEFDLSQPQHDGTFVTNGLSIIRDLYKESTGIADFNTVASVKIFPNPAKDIVNIMVSNNVASTIVEITNAEGMAVKSVLLADDKAVVDISGLPAGVYFVKVRLDTGIIIQKLIIK